MNYLDGRPDTKRLKSYVLAKDLKTTASAQSRFDAFQVLIIFNCSHDFIKVEYESVFIIHQILK